ncbi:acyl-CoA dehydrogenase family protein [Mycolicibacterium brisbanense]|nr:acyl-CoA dehydrogenase family protein [Mycolicibacterium brisbanense]
MTTPSNGTDHHAALSVDPDLVGMMNAVFADQRKSGPAAAPITRDAGLWQRLDELGLVRLTGREETGGSAAGWPEAAELMAAAVRHGIRIPLAEHDLLACWLLDVVGLPADGAARTICVLGHDGTARHVPWASTAERVVVVWPTGIHYYAADLDVSDPAVQITQGTNMIGEPRDSISADLTALAGTPVAAGQLTQLKLKSALVRSIQVCAALDRILELTIEHTSSRAQFGRSLSKFQAVQNMVADIAAEAALARAATEAALTAVVQSAWSAPNLEFLVAVARSCAGHATSVVVRNAHQACGAIGTTMEHRLHEYTRPALTWRSEFGSVQSWDAVVTDAARCVGSRGLWSLIAD